GTLSYSYTLEATVDNDSVDGATDTGYLDSFAVSVVDADGSSAGASLDIQVVDDAPAAADDPDASIAEDTTTALTGDVLANDTQGADRPASVAFDSTEASYGTFTDTGGGTWNYSLDNGLAAVQALGPNDTLTEIFAYTLTDADGDESTATLTITITGQDDGVTLSGLSAESAEQTVDEANLPLGATPEAAALTQSGTFSFVALDELGSLSVGDQTLSLADLQGLSAATPVTVSSDFGTLRLTGFSGDAAGGTLSYSYTLEATVDNDSVDGATDTGYLDSFAVSVVDTDGSSAGASLDIQIVDDVPQPFYPKSAHVLLDVSADGTTEKTVTQSLNFVAGADGLGDIVFDLDLLDGRQAFVSVDGDRLFLNNEPLFLQYTNEGDLSSIQAVTDSGEIGFTATIDAEGNVTYTIFSGSILTDAKITSVTDLSGIGGGNVPFKGLNIGTKQAADPDGTDDVLVSSEINPLDNADQGTVNSTSTTLGVGQGAEVSSGEFIRYDLVKNLSVDDTKNAASYSFDGYQETLAFSQKVAVDGSQKEATFHLRIYAMDLDDSATGATSSLVSGSGGDRQLVLTVAEVKIYDENRIEQTGHVTIEGDELLVSGMQDGWTFEIVSVDDDGEPEAFNAVEIEAVEGGATTSFKLGEFSYGEEPTFSPVTFALPVIGSDADGDSVDGQVTITVYPDSESIVGDSQDNTLSGTDGDDSLFGLEGDDTLTGGRGDDVLAGGLGADTFAWQFGDGGDQGMPGSPATDLVTDFNLNEADEGDVLALSDLLQGTDTAADFADYLQAVDDGQGNTLLHVSTSGAFGGGFSSEESDQVIALNGVSMDGVDSTAFIQSLIDNNQLDID
ncbi:MAG: type I secretion C-terminal target domain-containing protein, partial [Halomonas sp.]|nr:type I secretion C-terminal target domain-containing protein [Halomonas sp.]